jgi:hypothetical protein
MNEYTIEISVIVMLASIILGLVFGESLTRTELMTEAYNRGHAVQCLGRTGYYWECPN